MIHYEGEAGVSGRGITILYHCTYVLLMGCDILATFYIEVYAVSFCYYQFSLLCVHARASVVLLQCASEDQHDG